MELRAIQMYSNKVRLERYQIGNAADLGIGIRIRPCRQTCVPNVVIPAEPFVRAKGLMFHRSEGGLVDVGTQNIPARRKTGFVENDGPFRIGDYAVAMAYYQPARRLANIDATVAVRGMA